MKQFSATDIKVDNLSIDGHIDKLKLAAIEQTKSDTAVDVFVYDTSLDSDAGAWRKRTTHTSWYNETLNTSTRGSRREFPAVAVIVVEEAKVTIYDGDAPDMPMWMVFNTIYSSDREMIRQGISCVEALNGTVAIGHNGTSNNNRLSLVHFIQDGASVYYDVLHARWKFDISQRNQTSITNPYLPIPDSPVLVNRFVNDVTMTILPGAPTDNATGLPVPTFAVATDGGISVIKHDGTIVNLTRGNSGIKFKHVRFYDNNKRIVFREDGNAISYGLIPTTDQLWYDWREGYYNETTTMPCTLNQIDTGLVVTTDDMMVVPSDQGVSLIDVNKDDHLTSAGCDITSNYNTGWMSGDIKLATLSDSVVETVGVDETELVANGTFVSDTTGWDGTNSATLSIDNQRLKIQGGGASYPSAYTSIQVVEGVEYEVSARYISNDSSMSARVRISDPNPLAGDIINGTIKTPGNDHVYRFIAPRTGSIYVTLLIQDVNGNSSGIWDNVSVKQTGELITNGTFDDGIEGWSAFNLTISHDSSDNSILKTGGGDWNRIYQAITGLVVGETYTVSFKAKSNTTYVSNGQARMLNGTVTSFDINNWATAIPVTDGKDLSGGYEYFSGTFVATSTTMTFAVVTDPDIDSTFNMDDVSIRLAEDDRSVNDNGLQVFGEIDKTPVAPGADLVAYSGFSANNYLMQPYNSDLDFGTGDFSFTYWINSPSIDYDQSILCQGDYTISTNNRGIYSLVYNSGNSDGNDILVGVGAENVSVGAHENSGWIQIYAVRRSGILSVYKNGVLQGQTSSVTDINYSNIENNNLVIGAMYATSKEGISFAYDGSIALLRISASTPTPEQIAKIYHDEKMLFQPGAKCTLDGTSDAVTALAHDSVTDLLHVGTSSGTSVFSGLCRVTSDTEPVTTCIDAQDELVVKR